MPFSISLYNKDIVKKIWLATDSPIKGYSLTVGKEYIFENKNGTISVFEPKTLTFSIKHTIFRDCKTSFTILSSTILSYQDGNEIPPTETAHICGAFYNTYKDATYSAEGYWAPGKSGSTIFKITAYSQLRSSSITVIEEYFKNILKGLSVGPITIRKITDVYGLESIEKIKNDDPSLKTIIKNTPKREAIIRSVRAQEEKEKALQYLIQWEIPISSTINIIESLGVIAYSSIKNNPNILFKFLSIPSKTIDKMSQAEGKKYDDYLRIVGFLKRYIYSRETILGDIYVDYSDFIPDSLDKTRSDSLFSSFVLKYGTFRTPLNTAQIQGALNELERLGELIVELKVSDGSKKCVYRQYFNFAENKIIEKVKDKISGLCYHNVPSNNIISKIRDLEASGFKLDVKQKKAISMALQNPISILSGGPGTGKTQIIKNIVDIFMSTYPTAKIQLCAPTGKASRRMSEVISLPASTIHKSLNYVPFSEVDMTDIVADFLIIDETSMMDIDLFYKVLTHISEETTVLLVGDYNQLPSVGPGLVLRDLIDSNKIPTTILTKVFRQTTGSEIVDVAYNILNNKTSSIKSYKDGDIITPSDFTFIQEDNERDTFNSIKKHLLNLINVDHVNPDKIQLITPSNNGRLGVAGLNLLCKSIINPVSSGKEIYISPTKTFTENDRVLQTKNNYDLGVFNGSIGIIVKIDDVKNSATINFDGIDYTYSHKDCMDLKLGYAITVHKSQGSEFEYVIMPMSSDHSFVNNRNLLYTAVTRARIKFDMFGQLSAFVDTCNATEHFSRKSQIKDKLMR